MTTEWGSIAGLLLLEHIVDIHIHTYTYTSEQEIFFFSLFLFVGLFFPLFWVFLFALGVFPVDDVCAEWIEQRVKENKGQHPRFAHPPTHLFFLINLTNFYKTTQKIKKLNQTPIKKRWNEEMIKNTEISMKSLLPDKNAPYYRHITLDLSSVTPLVTGFWVGVCVCVCGRVCGWVRVGVSVCGRVCGWVRVGVSVCVGVFSQSP